MLLQNLHTFFQRIRPAPPEWLEARVNPTDTDHPDADDKTPVLEPLPCTTYSELMDAWDRAMRWTDELDIALSAMLGVVASTKLIDDQVFLRLIAKAGTAKTTLCEAVSVNRKYVFATSKVRGLHSGATSDDGKDHSLFSRMLDKTTIFNEGDMIVKNPNVNEILAELRDVWSGVTRANYRNGKHAEYHGIRASVIIAGTPVLRQLNRSSAGDRFLDCIAYEKESDDAEIQLVRSILDDSLEASLIESNGCPETRLSPEKIYAYRKTAGYVSFLRENIGQHLRGLYERAEIPTDLNRNCEGMGRLVAHMRTRPTGGDEDATEAELHVRLSKQLRKMALCLSLVLGKPIEGEVMRRTARIARDTCYGTTWNVCRVLMGGPLDTQAVALKLNLPISAQAKIRVALGTLNELGCVRQDIAVAPSGAKGRNAHIWRLTPTATNMIVRLRGMLGGRIY